LTAVLAPVPMQMSVVNVHTNFEHNAPNAADHPAGWMNLGMRGLCDYLKISYNNVNYNKL